MSYILDALKKSEQERQQHQAPTVHSIYAAARPAATSSPLSFRSVLMAVLLGGGMCAGAVWLAIENNWLSLTMPQPPVVSETAAEKNDVNAVDDAKEIAAKPVVANDTAVNLAPKTAAVAVAEKTAVVSTDVAATDTEINAAITTVTDDGELLPPMPVNELPEAVRGSLPPMTYSFHVYSTDKAKCTIIINSRRYREGELIANGWFLDSITESGIVVRKQRYRAAIQVVDTW